MKVNLEITGIESVSAMLQKGQQQIEDEIRAALNKSALRIVADAKKAAPVDTGRLRASITMMSNVAGRGLVLEVGTNVEYAAAVEYGTGRRGAESTGQTQYYKRTWAGQRAQPYLFPAFERERPRLIAELKRIVG